MKNIKILLTFLVHLSFICFLIGSFELVIFNDITVGIFAIINLINFYKAIELRKEIKD